LDRNAFQEELSFEGRARYHDRHEFHRRMHAGLLSRRQLRVWVENRYYYQTRLPIKDALIVAKSDDPAFRREWTRRILEQDGTGGEPGGLALWLTLAEGVGLDPVRVQTFAGVLPGVRAACDRYVSFVREASLVEAVASSLTECFAPELMQRRIAAWDTHYPWVPRKMRTYFDARVSRARTDAVHGLEFVLSHATARETQERCVAALVMKCGILWEMLDAIEDGCDYAAASENRV
jgi:pyrroloquinoline-quinone synthase